MHSIRGVKAESASLYCTIRADGRVVTSLPAVRARLAHVPALRQLSRGTVLRFELLGERGAVLSLSPGSISLTYALCGRMGERRAALTKLLAIAAILHGDYDVDFWSVYRDVIEALAPMADAASDGAGIHRERLERQLGALSVSNFNLANEVIELEKRLRSAEGLAAMHKALLQKVEEYCNRAVPGSNSMERLSAVIGTELAERAGRGAGGAEPGRMVRLWKRTTR